MKNKDQFVTEIAEKLGKSKKEVSEFLTATEEVLKETVAAKDVVRLPGFIEIGSKHKNSRKVRNPKTGETKMSEPKDVPYARFFKLESWK